MAKVYIGDSFTDIIVDVGFIPGHSDSTDMSVLFFVRKPDGNEVFLETEQVEGDENLGKYRHFVDATDFFDQAGQYKLQAKAYIHFDGTDYELWGDTAIFQVYNRWA